MKSIYLLKEDFKDFPIGEFPYDKNHSAMGEYHFVQYPGYYGFFCLIYSHYFLIKIFSQHSLFSIILFHKLRLPHFS